MRTSSVDFSLLERFWRDPPERLVLANGLTVLLKRDASAAIVSVQAWVKTGSIHEETQLGAGLSHFLEHMLFKGTGRRAGREISATVQAHGGYINAYTTFDRTVYYIDLPAEHTAVAVDILADAVLHSTLPADEVTRERDVILREIDMGQDDDGYYATFAEPTEEEKETEAYQRAAKKVADDLAYAASLENRLQIACAIARRS